MINSPLILASGSKSRLRLLKQINIIPDIISPANIDESPLEKELPNRLALRLAIAKGMSITKSHDNAIIISADTVTARGRRILDKASNDDDVRNSLELLSGRRHRVYTGLSIIKTSDGNIIKSLSRLVTTIIKFKRLDEEEIKQYIDSKEGIGKSGGCAINGIAESFVLFIRGSYSNVIGLPLYETRSLLKAVDYYKDK